MRKTKTPSTASGPTQRDLRRAQQRLANVGRAAKMHAARIAYEKNARQLKTPFEGPSIAVSDYVTPMVNIGCSGWFYWHWKERFYPRDMPTKQWFEHYANQFQTVELNAPFYSWPTVAGVKSWIRQVSDRPFNYTIKVCELITHVKRFASTSQWVRDFGFIGDLLGPHMGCFLFQLPSSFQFTSARLKRVLGQLDPRRRNVIEFRHASWWNKQTMDAFRDANAIFCSCSAPGLPDELIKTSDDIYIRFHGLKRWYRHDYSKEQLAVWAKRIHQSKPKRIWAYFNNGYEAHAVENARELIRQLKSFRSI